MLGLARLMRLASIAICLIVGVSFLVFAVDQTSNASHHQQEQLSGTPVSSTSSAANSAVAPGATSPTRSSSAGPPRESGLHSEIDDVSNKLTSPFSGVVSSSSEWTVRGVKLLLTLLVYGFGLGYVARVIRVRA